MPEPRRADGERGGQRDVRVVLAGQRQQAHGDVHVGGREHAGLVERAQRHRRPQHAADLERVGVEQLAHRAPPESRTSLSAVTSAPGGRHANTPHGAPSTRGTSGAGHPAQEQVEHAREVLVRVVAAQPPAQVAVQRHRVEQRLEPVVRVLHLGRQRGGPVVPGAQRLARRGEPVRLVVGDREAPARQPQDEVQAAGEEAAHGVAQARVRQPRRVAGQRVAGRQVLGQHGGDRAQRERAGRVVAADQRQLEAELVEPVRARDVAQPQVADERPERRLDRRRQALHDVLGVAELDPAPRLRLRDVAGQLGAQVGRREVRRLQHPVHERADVHADAHVRQHRGHLAQRLLAARGSGSGAGTSGSSAISASSGSLATRAS